MHKHVQFVKYCGISVNRDGSWYILLILEAMTVLSDDNPIVLYVNRNVSLTEKIPLNPVFFCGVGNYFHILVHQRMLYSSIVTNKAWMLQVDDLSSVTNEALRSSTHSALADYHTKCLMSKTSESELFYMIDWMVNRFLRWCFWL